MSFLGFLADCGEIALRAIFGGRTVDEWIDRDEARRQALVDAEAECEVHEPAATGPAAGIGPEAVSDRGSDAAGESPASGRPTSELLREGADCLAFLAGYAADSNYSPRAIWLAAAFIERADLLADIEPSPK